MNILFINIFFVGFMVSEIPRVSVFGYCPYSVTFPYTVFTVIKFKMLLFSFNYCFFQHLLNTNPIHLYYYCYSNIY